MKQKCEYCHKKVKHTKLVEHYRTFYYVCKECHKDIKRHHAREELNEQLKRTAIMLVATVITFIVLGVIAYSLSKGTI